ncbi:xyloside xylosyltransferase 1 [Ciona intestinalis]
MAGQRGQNTQRRSRGQINGLMSNLLSSKVMQVLLFLCILSSVFLFYNFGTTTQTFTKESKAFYRAENHPINVKSDREEQIAGTFEGKQAKAAKDQSQKHADEFKNDYHVLFIFAHKNPKLEKKFTTAFGSMFEHAKFNERETFHLHFVCEKEGKEFVQQYFKEHVSHPKFNLKIHFHDTIKLARQVHPLVQGIQAMLGNDHPYFSDTAIFFLSMVLPNIMPENIHRLVQLDLDLKFVTNIRDLWSEFDYFTKDTVIGIGNENQPVYRHLLWQYRNENPNTKVGEPYPTGQPGFNSGVVLLHLDNMRISNLYNSYMNATNLQRIVQKYHFKGHLGDQDFYTLLAFEHPPLFHVLPCGWNKQLCQWWKDKGYQDIFDQYFDCKSEIKIWHGNCDSPFPE